MPIPELTPGTLVEGLIAHGSAEVVSVKRHGSSMTVTFRDVSTGKVDEVVVFDTDGHKIKVVEAGRAWEFDGAGDLFRLAAEAHRIPSRTARRACLMPCLMPYPWGMLSGPSLPPCVTSAGISCTGRRVQA